MFHVEEMTPADLPEVLAIEETSFTNPWTSGMFMVEMSLAHSRMRVLRDKDSQEMAPVAGYVCSWYVADEVHIHDLAVHPSLRRKGLAGMLMEDLLRDARQKRAVRVLLEVRESNVSARNFYRTIGFSEMGKRRKYYDKPTEDAVCMVLELQT